MQEAQHPIRRSLRGNVDRNLLHVPHDAAASGRSLRGNVDRNNMTEAEKDRNWRRSLRGNVDRNYTDL